MHWLHCANKNEKISFERNLDCIADKKSLPQVFERDPGSEIQSRQVLFRPLWVDGEARPRIYVDFSSNNINNSHFGWRTWLMRVFLPKISSHKSKLCPHWKKGMLGAWTRIYENRPKPGYGQQGLKDGILGPRFNSGGKNSGFSQQKHHTFSFLTGSQLTF